MLCSHTIMYFQKFFIIPEDLYPLNNNSPSLPPSTPINLYSTLCLYEFAYSGYLV